MIDTRRRDVIWSVTNSAGEIMSVDHAILAVLMDIRDRLDVLRCPDFRAIPDRLIRLDRSVRNLRRPCRRRHYPPEKRPAK